MKMCKPLRLIAQQPSNAPWLGSVEQRLSYRLRSIPGKGCACVRVCMTLFLGTTHLSPTLLVILAHFVSFNRIDSCLSDTNHLVAQWAVQAGMAVAQHSKCSALISGREWSISHAYSGNIKVEFNAYRASLEHSISLSQIHWVRKRYDKRLEIPRAVFLGHR